MPDKEINFNPRKVFPDSHFTCVNSFLGFEHSDPALDAWLQCARDDFNSIYQRIYGACRRSIDPIALAEMEVRELNRFFECGECLSMAVNIEEHLFRGSEPLFKVDLSSEVIFNHYLMLLRGNYDTFLTKWLLEFLSKGCVNIEPDNLGDKQNIKWWATARVQALMWARDYLEDLIKEGKAGDIINPQKQGFDVKNETVIPALHEALMKNNLIEVISLNDFKEAFLKGRGLITWTGNKDRLGYLIKTLRSKNIITSKNHMETATRIFKATRGKDLNAGSLSTSADNLSDTGISLMDEIIKKC